MGILQARILEWVAMPSSRGSSQPRDWTQVSRIAGRFFTVWATRESPLLCILHQLFKDNCHVSPLVLIYWPTLLVFHVFLKWFFCHPHLNSSYLFNALLMLFISVLSLDIRTVSMKWKQYYVKRYHYSCFTEMKIGISERLKKYIIKSKPLHCTLHMTYHCCFLPLVTT